MGNYKILLTFDVEDWFQVENFKQCIPFESWASYDLRVERNTNALLDLLDSIPLKKGKRKENPGNRKQEREDSKEERNISEQSCQSARLRADKSCQKEEDKIRSTFFVLGWIAERLPHLVREIHKRGHEVASHGYGHKLCNACSTRDLKRDLLESREQLEDIIGHTVYGYRAPSFSINENILRVIEECGYTYDSSFNSFGMHDRYGRIDLDGNGRKGVAYQLSSHFYEIPISNLILHGKIIPWGGGGYFRLVPFFIFRKGVQKILDSEAVYLFYLHPWEIDKNQPRVREAPRFFRLRHYMNIKTTQKKLSKFIINFSQSSFLSCNQYIEAVEQSPHGNYGHPQKPF